MGNYEVYSDLQEISSNQEVKAIFKDNNQEFSQRVTHTARLRSYGYSDVDFIYSYVFVNDLGYFESPMTCSNFDRFEVKFKEKKEIQKTIEEVWKK